MAAIGQQLAPEQAVGAVSNSVSSDPAVITDEVIAANGQTASIRSVKDHNGTELYSMDASGHVTKMLYDVSDYAAYASYIIYIVGSTYYCKSGASGKVLTSGANAATVIQYALDELATDLGGTLLIKKGAYPLATGLVVAGSGIHIVGEGRNENADGGTVLDYDCPTEGFAIFASKAATRLNNISVSNLSIMASGTSQTFGNAHGILFDTCEVCRVDQVNIRGFSAGTAIGVMCRSNLSDEYSENIMVNHCFLYLNKYGLYANGNNNSGNGVNRVKADNVVIIGTGSTTGYGIIWGPYTDSCLVSGGNVENCLYALENYGLNNTYFGSRTEFDANQLNIDTGASNCAVFGHTFSGGGTYLTGAYIGFPYTRYYACSGLVTESRSEAVIPNGQTSVVVTHYCPTAPWTVLITGENQDTGACWVDTIGATTFTIHAPAAVGGDRIIKWRADL